MASRGLCRSPIGGYTKRRGPCAAIGWWCGKGGAQAPAAPRGDLGWEEREPGKPRVPEKRERKKKKNPHTQTQKNRSFSPDFPAAALRRPRAGFPAREAGLDFRGGLSGIPSQSPGESPAFPRLSTGNGCAGARDLRLQPYSSLDGDFLWVGRSCPSSETPDLE